MILVDTSAWVEYDRATGSLPDQMLTEAISTGGTEVAVTEPILMELLAGARDETARQTIRDLLTSFQWIPVDPVADFEGAAKVYFECRRRGITPRGLLDCMVASIAIRSGAELLATDTDFGQIATVLPLRLHTPR